MDQAQHTVRVKQARGLARHCRVILRRLHRNRAGATTLEWALLLAAVAIPSYWIIKLCLATLVAYYHAASVMNSLPFP